MMYGQAIRPENDEYCHASRARPVAAVYPGAHSVHPALAGLGEQRQQRPQCLGE
jgi:hypothetical protein